MHKIPQYHLMQHEHDIKQGLKIILLVQIPELHTYMTCTTGKSNSKLSISCHSYRAIRQDKIQQNNVFLSECQQNAMVRTISYL